MHNFIPRKEAEKIVTHARMHLTNEEGIFIQGTASKGRRFTTTLIDDLGDFLPLISFFGFEDICEEHLVHLAKHRPDRSFDKAFFFADLLFGLIWYGRIGKHASRAQRLANDIGEAFAQEYLSGNPGSYRLHGLRLPIFNTLDTTFIEVYTELFRDTKNSQHLAIARRLFNYLDEDQFFRTHGLLPEVIATSFLAAPLTYLFPRKFCGVDIMKNNTSFGWSLLDLWRLTEDVRVKDAFEHLYEGFRAHAVEPAGVVSHPRINERNIEPPSLLASFASIDLFTDAHHVFGEEKYIQLAREIADGLLKEQSAKTGLLPRFSGGGESYLDSETDLSISLFKLAEKTGEQRYRDAAKRIVHGIFTHHAHDGAYVLSVDIKTGRIVNDCVKTKFNLLLLKPLIYLEMQKPIYSDEKLFMLLKDR